MFLYKNNNKYKYLILNIKNVIKYSQYSYIYIQL